MKLLIIRHGDPDYVNDTLTPQGEKEAELLAKWLKTQKITKAYVSPLGRAQRTAQIGLKFTGLSAETKEWLREFHYPIQNTETGSNSLVWDMLPRYYSDKENLFITESWLNTNFINNSEIPKKYKEVTAGLDELLAFHGYTRENRIYRTKNGNTDVIALFCHFGLKSVLLSHLLNIPPFQLMHGFCAAPTSITTLYTEEREKSYVHFRCTSYGATPHLDTNGVEPSFSARFCEVYENTDRH